VRYVDINSASPTVPYTNWASAARVIQNAVDAAGPGDEIVVTNGLYATGGRAMASNLLANRVAVDKPLTLRSVNGPQFTVIQGYQVPDTTNGDGAVRCVYLAGGAGLSGFTLTNGATRTNGWDWVEQSGGGVCCESSAVVSNCVVVGNSAGTFGGGAHQGTLYNCTLTGNSVWWAGGGSCGCTLNNCTLTGNLAEVGGGAFEGTLNNCSLSNNSAGWGGGAYRGHLNNCTLSSNSADSGGGGAVVTLNNCTLTGNSAHFGGAASDGRGDLDMGAINELNNCVVYFNLASIGANYGGSCTLNFCCTTPMPTNGIGNITNAPLFVDAAAGNYRLRPDSPCIDAGTNLSAIITNDLDGRPRPVDGNGDGVAAFDIGAYEFRVLLVSQDSLNPSPPYGTWATAAHTIQEAVDVAVVGDEIVVTNGTYSSGGRAVGTSLLVNRVAVDKPLTLRSANGPQFTIIQGYQVPGTINGDGAVRCVYLTNGAILSGFTLTNGATRTDGDYDREQSGGGVWCESSAEVSNCVVVGSSAGWGGGGAYGATLYNCTLAGNSAYEGGGAYRTTLIHCTLTGNSAAWGGGARETTLSDCRLTGNSAADGGGAFYCTLYNSTLTDNLASGSGGGACAGTLNNCILAGNSASGSGGGGVGRHAQQLHVDRQLGWVERWRGERLD
jgi:predicted outer membrane repeat protein